eukprot:366458-Chlamydomonas_euryale.AAC.32
MMTRSGLVFCVYSCRLSISDMSSGFCHSCASARGSHMLGYGWWEWRSVWGICVHAAAARMGVEGAREEYEEWEWARMSACMHQPHGWDAGARERYKGWEFACVHAAAARVATQARVGDIKGGSLHACMQQPRGCQCRRAWHDAQPREYAYVHWSELLGARPHQQARRDIGTGVKGHRHRFVNHCVGSGDGDGVGGGGVGIGGGVGDGVGGGLFALGSGGSRSVWNAPLCALGREAGWGGSRSVWNAPLCALGREARGGGFKMRLERTSVRTGKPASGSAIWSSTPSMPS